MAAQILNDSKFHNYLDAALALLFTKQGTQPFVKCEIERLQKQCLTDSNGQSLAPCSSCQTENVVKCPTEGTCKVSYNKCRYHKNSATKYKSCPNHICDRFCTDIINAHQHGDPSFLNTDAKQWCSNVTEVAKCFMHREGYKDVQSLEETDFNGIINVCLNHKGIRNKIMNTSLLEQSREVGKKIRHCPNLQIEDKALQDYLTTLTSLLDEVAKIATGNDAIEAKEKIIQLKKEEDKRILKIINASMSAIKGQEELSISALKDVVSEALDEIIEEKNKAILEIGVHVKKGKESIANAVAKDRENIKEKFRTDLLMFNNNEHNSVQLSPLFEEINTLVEDFYVTPDMVKMIKKETIPITYLEDVFFKKSERYNEVYITAEAGFGKTAFCKRLVMAWCHAQKKKDEEHRCFSKEDISTMSKFDFIFLVSLRDVGDECTIDKMIFKHIVQIMARPSTYSIEFLEEILTQEPCLVILDGLDEWMHKPNECTKPDKQVPHRNFRTNTTIATTTRPWKISVLALKTSDIKNEVEIKGLNKESERQLTKNAFTKMNEYDESDDTTRDIDAQAEKFDAAIQNSAIRTLQKIPLLLLYMICLWKYEIGFGRSISEFYIRVIEFLLSKCKENLQSKNTQEDSVPLCFEEHKNCKTHYQILIKIGKLAFQTLFSETRENTLVFNRETANNYLSDEYLDYSLKTGILTQTKIQNMMNSYRKISFAHKSVHEFFAALYIHVYIQKPEDILKNVKPICKDIDVIFQMKLVFSFLSGIGLQFSEPLFQMITEVVANDQRTQDYRRSSLIWDRDITQALEGIQNMFVDIYNENNDSDREKDVLCLQDFFIGHECKSAKYTSALKDLLSKNKNNIKTISIKQSEVMPHFDVILETFKLNEIKGLEKVFYKHDKIGEEVNILLKGSKDTLKYLTLKCHKWDEDIKCKWPSTLSDQLRNLEGIAIEGFVFEHKLLQDLLEYLKNDALPLEVSLYNLKCADHGSDGCCTLDLSANERIKVLRLKCIPLSDMKINVTSLDTCDVGKLGIVETYLQQLGSAEKLTTFLCSFLESETDIECMLKTLPSLCHVSRIQLRKMSVGENNLDLPSEIKKITLWQIKISVQSLMKLKDDMEEMYEKSICVEIKDCTIQPNQEEFEKFKDDIRRSEKFSVANPDGKCGPNSFVFSTKP